MSMDDPVLREAVQTALTEAEYAFVRRMATFYEDIALMLGLRVRPPFTSFETLAMLGAAVLEGRGLRQIALPDQTPSGRTSTSARPTATFVTR